MNKQEIEKAISLLKSDIGVLDNYLKKHPHLEKDRCIENQLIKDMEFTISALEHQLTNGWIPVSERLPKENGHYLVTYHEWSKGEYLPKFDFTCMKILRFYRGKFRMPICCDNKLEEDIHREVLAWRELPEPYRDDICKINDAMFQCRHALSGKINDIGEIILHCEITDNFENVTLGNCIGNCEYQEVEG